MSERRQPGPHPDADRLSAFMESALTEQERQECLTHLAECAECRSIVFLAQQAVPALPPQPVPLPLWRRWMPPLSLAAAAVACGLIAIVWMRPHPTPAPASREAAIARTTAPPLPPSSAPPAEPGPVRPVAPARSRQELAAKRPAAPPPPPSAPMQAPAPAPSDAIRGITAGAAVQSAEPAAQQTAPTVASSQAQTALAEHGAQSQLAPAPAAGSAAPEQRAQGNFAAMRASRSAPSATAAPSPLTTGPVINGLLAPVDALHLTIEHNQGPDNGLSAIRGAVTDPSGAVVPRASVTVQSAAGAIAATATTDTDGRFTLPDLEPGQYDLRISAPGFQTDSERLDLQARDLALVSPVLQVGASTQTVEVNSESSALQTIPVPTDARLDAIVPVLPGKLPAATRVVKNGRILALDTGGTLYLSRDAGRHWKRIHPAWTGSIAHLVLAPEAGSSALAKRRISGISAAAPLFELTTTDGAIWVSSDGAHWRLR
jgi:hypothetical protein